MKPKILVAYEESATVREAFRRAGYDATSCDMKPTRVKGPHIRGDVFDVLRSGKRFDLVIAHPPCTYLTVSGLHWNKRNPERAKKTADALQHVRDLIDLLSRFPRWCIENPVGIISTQILPATQYVQPYAFGDDASKRTGLWLHNLPPLVADPAKRFPGRLVEWNGKTVERWSNQTDSGQNREPPSENRAEIRSVTYSGIADAMVAHWGRLL